MAIDTVGIATTLAQQGRLGEAPSATPGREAEAAREFESFMVEMMIQQMRKTVPEGLFQSTGVEMFSSMMDQAIAEEIAAAGGLGLADKIAADMQGSSTAVFAAPLNMAAEPGSASAGTPRAPFAGGALPVEGRISSRFGYRADPFHGGRRFHKGLDVAAPTGSPIHSLEGGKVTMAEDRPGYGKVVMVEHAGGWRSLYAHCDELEVSPGQQVGAGDRIATVGSTGRSTGPHLHLEIHHQGRAVDPAKALGW